MDKKNIDFPIFTIEAEEIDEKIIEAIELKEEIQEILEEIKEIKSNMDSSGKRLNFYINNIIDYNNKFDYKNHVVIFDDQNNLYIYSYKDIKRLDFEKMEETISSKKELFKQKINIKHINTCLDLIEQHNDIYIDYENTREDYEDIIDEYNCIIDEVKDIISDNDYDNDDEEFQPFDRDVHEILMVKFQEEGWKFIYVEKQYKDKLLNFLPGM